MEKSAACLPHAGSREAEFLLKWIFTASMVDVWNLISIKAAVAAASTEYLVVVFEMALANFEYNARNSLLRCSGSEIICHGRQWLPPPPWWQRQWLPLPLLLGRNGIAVII